MTKQTAYLLHADPTDAMLMHQFIQPEATKKVKKLAQVKHSEH